MKTSETKPSLYKIEMQAWAAIARQNHQKEGQPLI